MRNTMTSKRLLLLKTSLTVVLLCLLIIPAFALADTGRGHVTFLAEDGSLVQGIRCGVVDRSPPLHVLTKMQEIDRWLQENMQQFSADIPVAFHVIYSSSGEGNVAESQLQDQLEVLNLAYVSTGFSFSLASIDRTQNDEWYTVYPGTPEEREMKQALAIDPAHTLNFYTLKPTGGLLGWSWFPWDFAEDSIMHGVCILYSSLPGGTAYPYDEGDTGTHEIGHYLGLFHTFQNGCRIPGDYIADTPYEGEPAYGCPEGRDTCLYKRGEDPIYNYMDYSDDACMDEFTVNQAGMMQWAVSTFRPSLLD